MSPGRGVVQCKMSEIKPLRLLQITGSMARARRAGDRCAFASAGRIEAHLVQQGDAEAATKRISTSSSAPLPAARDLCSSCGEQDIYARRTLPDHQRFQYAACRQPASQPDRGADASSQVICLPIYPELEMATLDAIIAMIAAPAAQQEVVRNIA